MPYSNNSTIKPSSEKRNGKGYAKIKSFFDDESDNKKKNFFSMTSLLIN